MNIIGLDAHSASFTVAILNHAGKLSQCLTRATSQKALIDVVTAVHGQRMVVVEESPIAQWVKMSLEPYVDKLLICDPRQNRWIAKDDFCDDQTSAIKLAQLAWGGYVKEIYHPDDAGAELRGLFLHYFDLNRQLCRFKNKLKATFRQVGVKPTGKRIYACDEHERQEWLGTLSHHPHLRHQAGHLFTHIDLLEEMKHQTHRALSKRVCHEKAFDLLKGIPGVAEIIASGYLAMIVTPHRFSRKNKLWSRRCGTCLGNTFHQSDQVVYRSGPSPSGNRILKWLLIQHFQAAVHRCKAPNRFQTQHARWLARGLSPKEARRQTCRALISTVRAIWIKGEPYRELPLTE